MGTHETIACVMNGLIDFEKYTQNWSNHPVYNDGVLACHLGVGTEIGALLSSAVSSIISSIKYKIRSEQKTKD
jgi:hypothetical protein